MYSKQRYFWLAACALVVAIDAQEGPPPTYDLPRSEEVSFFNIPGTLNEISQTEGTLQAELGTLPMLNDSLQIEAYGYHGGYLPALAELPEKLDARFYV